MNRQEAIKWLKDQKRRGKLNYNDFLWRYQTYRFHDIERFKQAVAVLKGKEWTYGRSQDFRMLSPQSLGHPSNYKRQTIYEMLAFIPETPESIIDIEL